MNRDRGSTTGGAGGGPDRGGSDLHLEALLRLGDPEERGWVPPDFDVVRACALAPAPASVGRRRQGGTVRSSYASPRRQAVTWMLAAAAVVVALAMVVGVVLPSLPRAGLGGQPSGSGTPGRGATSSPALTPTLSAADLAAVARALGVPADRVLPTEDGAVAVRLHDGQLQLLLGRLSAGTWRADVIGSTPVLTAPAEPSATPQLGSSITALLCNDPTLVRIAYVYGTNGAVTDGAQLHLAPGPAIGGLIEDQLYVFALSRPVMTGTSESVLGPDGSFPGLHAGAFASGHFEGPITCLGR